MSSGTSYDIIGLLRRPFADDSVVGVLLLSLSFRARSLAEIFRVVVIFTPLAGSLVVAFISVIYNGTRFIYINFFI